MMATLAAVPHNRTDPQRRALIAKVHIAPKQLAMTDEDYRAVMRRITGKISAADCNVVQLQALVREFERMGFRTSAAPKKPGAVKRADHPVARKARALWISLGLLCGVRDYSEAALEAFARRQMGCDRFAWINQSQADKVIEALKAMLERHGSSQSIGRLPKIHLLFALKRHLCDAILFKLKRSGVIPSGWELGDAAWKLCRLGDPEQVQFQMEELDQIANGLGKVLRDKGGDRAFDPIADVGGTL